MIRLQDVQFSWPTGFTVEVDRWEIPRGGRGAVVGPSGSGKSTLLGILSGELQARGQVEVGGAALSSMGESARRAHRLSRIGMVLQDHPLVPHLSVVDNVCLPYRLGHLPLTPTVRERASGLLAQLEVPRRWPGELSQGERQRVAIARALVTEPAVLLADEPTSGLDAARADVVVQLLEQACEQREMTLVMVTHDRRLQQRFERRLELGDR